MHWATCNITALPVVWFPVPVGLPFPDPANSWHGGDGSIDGASCDRCGDRSVPGGYPVPADCTFNIDNTAGLSDGSDGIDGWLMARVLAGTFGLEFTDNGPEAYGLVSYSQSTDAMSPFFSDQSEQYSNKDYRQLFLLKEIFRRICCRRVRLLFLQSKAQSG